MLAVAAPPLAFQTNGPLGLSPAVETALVPVEQYGEFLYLNRGYAFFAPDPGPSHLIQAGMTDGAGNLTEEMYPDLEHQWPRLLYHRHFMLAEFLNDAHLPPGPPPELIEADPEAAENWRNARARYENLRLSMTEHLEHANPGSTAAIRRIEHLIPNVIDYQEEPIALNDKQLYEVLLDQPAVLQVDDDLIAPDRPPEAIDVPRGQESAPEEAETTAPREPAAGTKSDPVQAGETGRASVNQGSDSDDVTDNSAETES
jgi:hypothetical protein